MPIKEYKINRGNILASLIVTLFGIFAISAYAGVTKIFYTETKGIIGLGLYILVLTLLVVSGYLAGAYLLTSSNSKKEKKPSILNKLKENIPKLLDTYILIVFAFTLVLVIMQQKIGKLLYSVAPNLSVTDNLLIFIGIAIITSLVVIGTLTGLNMLQRKELHSRLEEILKNGRR